MKFMKKSEDRQKEMMKRDADLAITQIKEESTGFVSAVNKFGAK
jgi:hypothetical protein